MALAVAGRSVFLKRYDFDQASTSFPKAPGVGEAMADYINHVGVNVGRGTYGAAEDAALTVLGVRERLARLFHFCQRPGQVIFTPGATWGLNLILKGYLKPGDLVLISGMEHNAVMRPLRQLEKQGVRVARIPTDVTGSARMEAVPALLDASPSLVLVNHASNVSGTLFPLEEIAALCRQRGIPLAVDAAQTAGHLPIDFQALGLAALCVPGHKGLRGPQGIGAVLMEESFAQRVQPLITGGTGSHSDREEQPDYLPDRFESGTLNLPGIFGMRPALDWLLSRDIKALRQLEIKRTARLLEGLKNAGPRIAGPANPQRQVGVVSLDFSPDLDNALAADRLERDFGVLTRCGLHCAPSAHRVLGTFPQGTVRLSIGPETGEEEIDWAVEAVRKTAEAGPC